MTTLTINFTCECGSDDFFVSEHIHWKAALSPDNGHLTAYSVLDNGIDAICCRSCGTEYDSAEFNDIDFS